MRRVAVALALIATAMVAGHSDASSSHEHHHNGNTPGNRPSGPMAHPDGFTWDSAFLRGQWRIHGLWPDFQESIGNREGPASLCKGKRYEEPTGNARDFVMQHWLPNPSGSQLGLFRHEWETHGCKYWDTVADFISYVRKFEADRGTPGCSEGCGEQPKEGLRCRFKCDAKARNCGEAACQGKWRTKNNWQPPSGEDDSENNDNIEATANNVVDRSDDPKPDAFTYDSAWIHGQWRIHGLWPDFEKSTGDREGPDSLCEGREYEAPTGEDHDFVIDHWLPNPRGSQMALFEHEWETHGCKYWDTVSDYIAYLRKWVPREGTPGCNRACGSEPSTHGQRCRLHCDAKATNCGDAKCQGVWSERPDRPMRKRVREVELPEDIPIADL